MVRCRNQWQGALRRQGRRNSEHGLQSDKTCDAADGGYRRTSESRQGLVVTPTFGGMFGPPCESYFEHGGEVLELSVRAEVPLGDPIRIFPPFLTGLSAQAPLNCCGLTGLPGEGVSRLPQRGLLSSGAMLVVDGTMGSWYLRCTIDVSAAQAGAIPDILSPSLGIPLALLRVFLFIEALCEIRLFSHERQQSSPRSLIAH
jgi:hypothetical protein